MNALERIGALSEPQRRELARRLGAAHDGAHLVACVQIKPDATLTAEEVRAFLLERLPAPVVPSAVVFVEDLPQLPSGKVDRRALREVAATPRPGAGQAAARSGTETAIAEIFREVLGVATLDVHDTFWSLGGQSVIAASIMGRVRRAFGVRLPIRALFDNPTVARLASRVEEAVGQAAAEAVPVTAAAEPRLSTAQRRVWLQQKLSPESVALNVVAALRVRGPLDAGALEWALNEIVARHEILRTACVEDRGLPVPRVSPAVPLRLERLTADAEALPEVVAAQARQPFDLTRAPLLRPALVRLAADDHALILASHHVAADKWAYVVLFRELTRLYAAAVQGFPSPLEPLAVQYSGYAAWEADLLARSLESGLEHWKRRLAGAPAGGPFAGRAREGGTGVFQVEVPEATVRALGAATAELGTSIFAATLAAYASALRGLTDRTDLVITVPTANRGATDWESLIGCFVNPVALRWDARVIPGGLLQWAHEAMLDANVHSYVPFEAVVNAVRPEREPDGQALSHVVLNFTEVVRPPELGDARVELLDVSALSLAKNDLTLYLDSGQGTLRGRFVYAKGVLSQEEAAALGDGFLAALAGLGRRR